MQSESFFTFRGLPLFPQNNDMTLQIGMLCNEGIVVIGDTWQYVEPSGANRLWYGYQASKFRLNDSGTIAVSCARNMDIASLLAESVFREFGGACANPRQTILDIAAEVATGHDVECMVILTDPYPALYALMCGTKDGEWVRRCEQVLNTWVSGDAGNPAYYWVMRYYIPTLSVRQLARVGAMVNVSAEKFNSGTIGGLEVVVCDKDGIRRWTKEENDLLGKEARNLTDQIGAMITT